MTPFAGMPPVVAAARAWLRGTDTSSIALVLSGGGFRATLFHLGVLRHMAEMGQLARVTHVTSVSGGSILAAHLVLHWDAYTGPPEQFNAASRQVLAFVRQDVRGRVVRRWLAGCLIPIPFLCRRLARFPGLGFLARPGEIGTLRHLLQRHYDRFLGGRRLVDLGAPTPSGAPRPDLHIVAVSLTTGSLASFSRRGLWIDEKPTPRQVPTETLPVSLAVTASSAFPPLFPPVRVDHRLVMTHRFDFPHTHYLADGGVYDNLGIHRLKRLEVSEGLDIGTVVVSDAGARSDWVTDDSFASPLTRNVRATDLLMSRISDLDNDTLQRGFWAKTVVVSLHDLVSRSDDPEALPPETQRSLATVRTDLDTFSEREIALLVRHGRTSARRRLGASAVEAAAAPAPTARSETPDTPDDNAPRETAEAPLLDSYRNRKRVFGWTDWSSWLAVAALALYLWGVVYYVGEPLLASWRFRQYDRARTVGGELRRARTVEAARKTLAELDVRLPIPLAGRLLEPLVESREIRDAKRALHDHVAVWARTQKRPEELDRAILKLTRMYGHAWSAESRGDAQELFKQLRVELFDRAFEVATNIAFYANLGAWASTARDRETFWALYWGDLGLVEGDAVESAMVWFRDSLPKDDSEPPNRGGLLEAAAGLGEAIDSELSREKTGSPRGFAFEYAGTGPFKTASPGRRIWLLARDGLWTERLPDGTFHVLPVVGRDRHEACLGTVVYSVPNRQAEFLVPDHGCSMVLWFRDRGRPDGWQRVAEMREIR